jgi:hypothetical protein
MSDAKSTCLEALTTARAQVGWMALGAAELAPLFTLRAHYLPFR